MDKKRINIVIGPGHHGNAVITALEQIGYQLKVFNYWPRFSVKTDGKQELVLSDKLYFVITQLSYALRNRMQRWVRWHWPMDHLLTWYDFLVSNHLDYRGKLLIGWPQVSLNSFRKWKRKGGICILEYPMIHVNEWMAIMEDAYEQTPGVNIKPGLFTRAMQQRMLQEYELADKINVLSKYAYDTFIKYGIPKKKLYISNLSVDTKTFQILNPDYPTEKYIFLFVGRLELLKGVHLLVEAFNELNIPDTELWLVGDKRQEINSYVKGENVKWLGTKNKQELVEIYNKASCLVLPSLQESYGLVILEAMACGLPVIASHKTGGPDIIKCPLLGAIFESGCKASLKVELKSIIERQVNSKEEIRSYILQNFSSNSYNEKIKTAFGL